MLLAALVLPVAAADQPLTLTVVGTYATGTFDEGGAEIAAYHPASSTVYVVNGATDTIDLLNISDPAAPALAGQIDVTQYGDGANSVAVFGDLLAVAIEADPAQNPGLVAFFTPAGEFIASYEVGALPDMLTFTPDGTQVITANEGEPTDDYATDPEGSISIIDVSAGAEAATVTTLGFTDFNAGGSRAAELPAAVRIYGPGASVAQDLEPEYVAVAPDSSTAFVTLQENNAYAIVDLAAPAITAIRSFGFKDHSVAGNGFDGGNDDGVINIATYPVLGMYQPDGIAVYEAGGTLYLVGANEGDTRDYDGYSEEGSVGETPLDATAFPNAADLAQESSIGGLEITTATGDTDGDGDIDVMYLPGARSFSIWTPLDGALVWDSGDALERITAETYPADFNATNDENGSFDDRSDNKGPEPEGLALGSINDHVYAFVGLERIGGVMVYDITDPAAPVFVTYVNNRDFGGDAEAGTAGDLGPEGLLFIPAAQSPTGFDLLVVTNEISGSTTLYQVSSGQ
jgi:hypothetical protein